MRNSLMPLMPRQSKSEFPTAHLLTEIPGCGLSASGTLKDRDNKEC